MFDTRVVYKMYCPFVKFGLIKNPFVTRFFKSGIACKREKCTKLVEYRLGKDWQTWLSYLTTTR